MANKQDNQFTATGKRKSSIARVFLTPGEGNIRVNKKSLEEYFGRTTLQMLVNQPFETTGLQNKFDVKVNVQGGGLAGQAGAVRHGISRALLEVDSEHRKPLKSDGLLTRDARKKERYKVGRRKARRSPQFSKR